MSIYKNHVSFPSVIHHTRYKSKSGIVHLYHFAMNALLLVASRLLLALLVLAAPHQVAGAGSTTDPTADLVLVLQGAWIGFILGLATASIFYSWQRSTYGKPTESWKSDGGGSAAGRSRKKPTQVETRTIDTKVVVRVNDLFQSVDDNKDGHIDAQELQTLCMNLQNKFGQALPANNLNRITLNDCKLIFDSLDTSKNGQLEKSEFVGWISMGLIKTEEECRQFAESGVMQQKLMNFLALIKKEIA